MHIEKHVDAPVEDLFDLLSDPETENDWNPDAIEVHRVGDGPIGPGARWKGRYKGMGEMDIVLDECDRPGRMRFTITGSRLDMDWSLVLAPDGDGTRLQVDADLEPKGAMRIAGPLLGPMMRQTFNRRPQQLAAGVAARRADS